VTVAPQIVQLGTTVSDLSKDIEEISTVVKVKETKIKELDETIHTAWYVFGTRKELKEQKINRKFLIKLIITPITATTKIFNFTAATNPNLNSSILS